MARRRTAKPSGERPTAREVIAFIEKFLRIPDGPNAGQPLILAPWQKHEIHRIYDHPIRRAIISTGKKNGKGLALDTPIATPRGWTTMGALKVGDEVFDERGQPCKVTFVSPVHIGLRCWRLRFADGSEIVADEQHRWLTKHRIGGDFDWGVVATPEIAARVRVVNRDGGIVEYTHKVPVASVLEIPEADLPIPPYVLGYWIGNGVAKAARVTTGFRDCTDIVEQLERELGFALRSPKASWKPPTWSLSRGYGAALPIVRRETVQHQLRELDVLNNKHIPEVYKWASREQRLALLQGLMDSDGYTGGITRRGTGTPRCYFANTNERLIHDTLFLVRSLGFKASVNEGRAKLNGRDLGPAWKVSFAAYREDEVFRLERRRDELLSRPSKRGRSAINAIVACDDVASVPTVCIQVDSPSHLFLAGHGLTPTHNTGLCAALLLNHLVGPSARNQRNARLFSSAMSRDQAALTFDAARKMILLNNDLRQTIAIKESAKLLRNNELGIEYKALSSEAHRAQGLNPTLHISDELGESVGPHSSLFEALELSTAAQRDVLTVVISTQAASDSDLLSTLIDDGLAGHDPTTVVSLYSAPKDLDPFAEAIIRLANPSFDTLMNRDEVLAMAAAACRLPARESAYRRYCLNQRIEQANPFVSPGVWNACHGMVASLNELPVLFGGY